MSIRRLIFFLIIAFAILLATGTQTTSLISNGNPDNTAELLAGRNVNMVSGTELPLGDPWLQRQNEPSIAVSSRNPMHLFAAANDYRTIDMDEPYEVRGIPGIAAGRDSWIGVFESFDGGESWVTMLLPGFPQDRSIEGMASPIYGIDTACDPRVCAGANGLFYLSGIAFYRNQMAGVVFVARYVDNNDREEVKEEIDPNSGHIKYVGPIEYKDTRIVGVGNPGQFIDMPNMAVDVPRDGAQHGNVYLAYTVFLGNTGLNIRSRIDFVTSKDGGVNWSKPIKLTESQHIIQRPVIAIDPNDPTGKTIYVVFRRFAHRQAPGGIAFVKSIDGGMSFTKPADVAPLLCPFDQWTVGDGTTTSPRTNSYPTMAIGGDGVPYVVWAQRYDQNGNLDPDGQSRIVFSYSQNGGMTWSEPQFVDPYYEGPGHQFMPSITCAGGNKTVIWYDQRDDIALHNPDVPHDPYEKFMEDAWEDHRHTIDVRAAEAPYGSVGFMPSILLSRYLYFMQLKENGEPYTDPETGEIRLWQGEYNYSGLPLFWLGTKPFQGDYIEVVPSPQILPPPAPGSNSWAFNTDPSEPTRAHGVWTDTRDVWPPAGDLWGDWITYNPPTSIQHLDFEQQNPCLNIDTTGMRNQNIYTADLNHGVIVGSPGNTKQLDIQRSFVVFVKDTIGYTDTNGVEGRSFHLSLQVGGGVNASFEQFDDVDTLDITVLPHSSVSSTVYVDQSENLFSPVIVNVEENGALVGRVYLNPDSTNNPLLDPDGNPLGNESHIPGMTNPKIWKYNVGNQDEPNPIFLSPKAQNPKAQNSGYVNPKAQNPKAQNPKAQNPKAQNPKAQNENIVNNNMYNPKAQNPKAQNTALTDMTWTVTNDGNTTSAFTFYIATEGWEDLNAEFDKPFDESLIAQVLVYKTHMVPIDRECELFLTHADELMVNYTNPKAQNPKAQNIPPTSSNITALGTSATTQGNGAEPITFYLGPGEQAEVIFRVWDPDTTQGNSFDDYIETVGGQTAAEAADTGQQEPALVEQPDAPWGDEPSYLPEIDTFPASLSFTAVLGTDPAGQDLIICNTGGGTLDYTISDDVDWLSVSPSEGTSPEPPGEGCDEQTHTVSVDISGLDIGTYQGTITITDPYATNNPVRVPVTLTISAASYLKVTGNSTVIAGDPKELTITAYDASHNVATSYTGSKSLTFSGPGTAPDGTVPKVEDVYIETSTTVNFTNGVSDTEAATLIAYMAETTSVDVTDGTIDSFADPSYDFDLIVTPASANSADTSISGVSPDPVTAGSSVTITVTAYDQYQNALTFGGGTVLINVTGANAATPAVTDNSNGTYTASYTPAVTGTDDITGTINGVAIGRDADGTSDGTYQLSVYAKIAGWVKYNGLPIAPSYTNAQAVFWARDEVTKQSFPISPTYDNSDGTYSIPNMPPGQYGVSVGLDAASPLDGRTFPGDYDGWIAPIVVPAGQAVVNQDLDCEKTIHLTAPIDNLNEQIWTPPYNTHQTPVTFQWDANTEASTYKIIVSRYQNPPNYGWIETYPEIIVNAPTTETNINLGESAENEHYEFQIYAYNAGAKMVGKFMIVYTSGYGWDYRFRVTPVVVSGYLSFVEQPSNSVGDQSISPAVQVKAEDEFGAPLPGVSITMGIETNPCSGTLSGGTVVSTLGDGIATFSNLNIDKGEEGYTLEATSAGLTSVISDPFNIEGFCDTGSLLTARSGHTATLLPNGKVLITGGQENGTFLKSAELYDPNAGTFSSTGSMGATRQYHRATLLRTGKVLITGGSIPGGLTLASAELYDPDAGTFSYTDAMENARENHTATLLTDGNVLISGGRGNPYTTLAGAELYDPSTGMFSSTGPMNTPRKKHSATLLANGMVLIAGGHYTAGLNSAELYDPGTGVFGPLESTMDQVRSSHTATLLSNGNVLIAGGGGGPLPESAELYDPFDDSFSTTGSMSTGRGNHTATLLSTSNVLITGGSPIPTAGSTAEVYDPTSGTFRPTGSLGAARYLHTATRLPDGKVLVTGGSASPSSLDSAEIFYPRITIVGGLMMGWGSNHYGKLGDGTTTETSTPVQVIDTSDPTGKLTDVMAADAGSNHSLTLKSDGSVWAWGFNGWGSLGDGTYDDSITAVQVVDSIDPTGYLTNVVSIAAGYNHNLAVKSDRSVWAWGRNYYGQLGDDSNTDRNKPVQVIVTSDPSVKLTDVVAVAASYNHSLALKSGGTVWAWGRNYHGKLGDGTTSDKDTAVQVIDPMDPTGYLTDVVAIAAGQIHSLALKSDGTVWAWGYNASGQLGDGTPTTRLSPVQVLKSKSPVEIPFTGVKAIAAGDIHSLALKIDGTVWGWGSNYLGELGDGTTATKITPVQTSGLTEVTAIAAGGHHSLALKSDGNAWAWGYNYYGQLGDGTTADKNTPVQVQNLTYVVAIEGGTLHSVAIMKPSGVTYVTYEFVTKWGGGRELGTASLQLLME